MKLFDYTGKEKFQEGLQVYMRRHAYGNTETIDLWNAWSEVSGKDVAALMRSWTTVMGYPCVKVVSETWSANEVQVTLEQTRFLSDGSVTAEDDTTLWCIPLLFATSGSTSQEAVVMDKKQQTFVIPVSPSTTSTSRPWVKINAGQKALIRVAHSAEMISRMQECITEVAPVDRAALLLDAYALAKSGQAPLETVVAILRALEEETSSIVWSAIAGVLGGLHLLMEQVGSDAFAQFVAFGKRTVLKGLEKVSFYLYYYLYYILSMILSYVSLYYGACRWAGTARLVSPTLTS